MTIPFSFPQLGAGPVVPLGPQVQYPDLGQTFLHAFLAAQSEKGQNSRSSAELDLQKQHLAWQMAQEKTKQEMLKAQGSAMQLLLERMAAPAVAEQGPMGTPMHYGGFGGAGGAPQPTGWTPSNNAPLPALQATPSAAGGVPAVAGPGPNPAMLSAPTAATPAPTSPYGILAQITRGLPPSAAAQFAHEALPVLMDQLKLNMAGKGQQTQYGEGVTTFVPGKGFWDPKANNGQGAFVPSIERGLSPDQKQLRQTELDIQRERLAAMRDYRVAVRSQQQTNQFNVRTKPLRERGQIINQAIQTISDAQNNPDPNVRKVLTSSAIANFVQAADQKAQLRYQLLDYFKKNIDPSIAGKWEVFKDRALHGTLPEYVTSGMLTHLNNLLKMSRDEYDRQRNGEIGRHPELSGWLPEADEFFSAEHPNGSAPIAPPGGLDQLIPPPPTP